jgi:hypothetical protein
VPPQRADNAAAGDPKVLGQAFHNPYTFIPFGRNPPRRHPPTPISIDEIETDRFTGVIDLEVKLLSPLLTANPTPAREERGHREHDVLAIGDDVIVPATGIRGALRSLMAVLTGDTLGHIDEEAWLCQGRDARLGPASKLTQGQVPERVFLAEVVKPGGARSSGSVRVGTTRLVKADDLDRLAQQSGMGSLPRPRPGQPVEHLWTDEALARLSRQGGPNDWKVKLSGRPINRKGKREGIFSASGQEITLLAPLWSAYQGRHRHADHPELRPGDLVWLEPTPGCQEIRSADDVKSIQWARWGREGERLLDVVWKHHRSLLPDSINPDGFVDEVTDLFGQVPRPDLTRKLPIDAGPEPKPAGPFAARVRCGNLRFAGAKGKVTATTLAPLCPPHPGCAAFYRDAGMAELGRAADEISNHHLPLRGYKVYRTTRERGTSAPWNYSEQGVYGDDGALKAPKQKVNKTCELLGEENAPTGELRLTVRALSGRELALLLAACSVDWRLGGGKPLGLGHCRVFAATLRELRDDGSLGDPIGLRRPGADPGSLPAPYDAELAADPEIVKRMAIWQASQKPVQRLRYPRAVIENLQKKNRGGHAWFQRHAQPSKAGDGQHPRGLQTLHLSSDGPLANAANAARLRAQPLPAFDPAEPEADLLYGHDLLAGEGPEWSDPGPDRRTLHKKLEPFDPKKHGRPRDESGGPQGQSRETRGEDRRRR